MELIFTVALHLQMHQIVQTISKVRGNIIRIIKASQQRIAKALEQHSCQNSIAVWHGKKYTTSPHQTLLHKLSNYWCALYKAICQKYAMEIAVYNTKTSDEQIHLDSQECRRARGDKSNTDHMNESNRMNSTDLLKGAWAT